MPEPFLDHATLLRLLHYDPETGVFVWRRRGDVREQWNGRYAGKRAGYKWSPGGKIFYWVIRIFDWPFLAHRVAVLYMTGAWPENLVDHRDRDGLNNRWRNLRDADRAQNAVNAGVTRASSTGLRGAFLCRETGRFRSQIKFEGRAIWLGYYETAEEAHAAYLVASRKYYGEFGGKP